MAEPIHLGLFLDVKSIHAPVGYWIIFQLVTGNGEYSGRSTFAWLPESPNLGANNPTTETLLQFSEGTSGKLTTASTNFTVDGATTSSFEARSRGITTGGHFVIDGNIQWDTPPQFMFPHWNSPPAPPELAQFVGWFIQADGGDIVGGGEDIKLYIRNFLCNPAPSFLIRVGDIPASRPISIDSVTVGCDWSDIGLTGHAEWTFESRLGLDDSLTWEVGIFPRSGSGIDPKKPATIEPPWEKALYHASIGASSFTDDAGENRVFVMPSGTYKFDFSSAVQFPDEKVRPAVWPTFTAVSDAEGNNGKYYWALDGDFPNQFLNPGVSPIGSPPGIVKKR